MKNKPFWQDVPLVGEHEIFGELESKKGSSLFLGRYSFNEMLSVLSKRSFLREARRRYLWPLEFDLDSSEFPVQRLRIFLREKDPKNVIVDLKVKEAEYLPKPGPASPKPPLPPQKALSFEWLTLQNPLLEFSEKRPRLPGQSHPGLSLSRKVLDLFVYLGRITRKDALMAFPAYFHNGLLFARYFHFWDPVLQGEVLGIRRAFSHMPLHKLAWIVHLGCLKRKDGEAYEWAATEQFHPLTRPLKEVFASRAYREAVRASRNRAEFSVDWDRFEEKKADLPDLCGPSGNLL
jgi:hypothetical protein